MVSIVYEIDSTFTSENLEAIRDIITSHQILHPAEILPKLTKRTPYPNKYYYGGQNRPASPFSCLSLYNVHY